MVILKAAFADIYVVQKSCFTSVSLQRSNQQTLFDFSIKSNVWLRCKQIQYSVVNTALEMTRFSGIKESCFPIFLFIIRKILRDMHEKAPTLANKHTHIVSS